MPSVPRASQGSREEDKTAIQVSKHRHEWLSIYLATNLIITGMLRMPSTLLDYTVRCKAEARGPLRMHKPGPAAQHMPGHVAAAHLQEKGNYW
jgi:hypothetical protein